MAALSAYSNVENISLNIIKSYGFQYWIDDQKYYCEKDGWDFIASSFTELLGLIKIYEIKNPQTFTEYWWKINEEWLLDNIPKEPQPYKPIYFEK